MTKAETLQEYFSTFGMPAYTAASVPMDVTFPYLAYELSTGNMDSGEVGLTVNVWYYATSEAIPNAKAQEISDRLGLGGAVLRTGGGYIWVKRGTPFCQSVHDESDPNIKRRYINFSVEYLTET